MEATEKRYPSDLSNREWEVLAPMMPVEGAGGRLRENSWRELLDGIFYISRGGGSWPRLAAERLWPTATPRMMPTDLPHWKISYHYFRLWRKSGLLEKLHTQLREKVRVKSGRNPQPRAASLDSQ
ncbi:MAG: transposase [Thermaceae bacterium]|nr:transposase [Thermaceae bacterium]